LSISFGFVLAPPIIYIQGLITLLEKTACFFNGGFLTMGQNFRLGKNFWRKKRIIF